MSEWWRTTLIICMWAGIIGIAIRLTVVMAAKSWYSAKYREVGKFITRREQLHKDEDQEEG